MHWQNLLNAPNFMTHLLVQKVEKLLIKSDTPDVKPGCTVKVYQKIKEGEKERIQIFEGLVIAMNHGHGASKTFMVRKVVEGIGVEKIFPLYSPNIAKIEIIRIGKVRRSKLFYMRDISGKAARLKEIMVSSATEETKAARVAAKAAGKTSKTKEVAEEKAVESTEVNSSGAETKNGDDQMSMSL